ncbi:MAG: cation-transporting P-type ATPase [Chlorobium sp.]|nr:MAG: cation-transporting P-type ATPase [Chlorobium sp.]
MIDFEALAEKSRKDIFLALNSSEKGLTDNEAKLRLASYGQNLIVFHRQKSPLLMFLGEFKALFPLLLLAASILAFFADFLSPGSGYSMIGIALLGVVVLNALFSFFQNYKAEKLMISFLDYIPKMVVLLRNGRKIMLDAKEIVPGDIFFTQEGDKIPADGIVLETNQMLVDESILTGESQAVTKTSLQNTLDQSCKIFSGSTVLKGSGRILVLRTGRCTNIGSISMLSQQLTSGLTPMQKELQHFVKKISWLALGIGIFFFLTGFLIGNPFWTNLVFAIGIIVASVPEGLLPAVTLALTQSCLRMSQHNAVVKEILSVETLGSTTVICTDKTGTLTQNKLETECFFINFKEVLSGDLVAYNHNPVSSQLTEIMGLCNDVMVTGDKEGRISFKGDPTEIAMAEFVERCAGYERLRSTFEPVSSQPFDPHTRSMSSTWRTKEGALYMTVKGAPEMMLEKCSDILTEGVVRHLTQEERELLQQKAEHYASDGFRVLALGFRANCDTETEIDHLVFAGLVALIDPPRAEVPAAVEACRKAGIRIIVMSGDNAGTVSYIARRLGIVKNPHIIEGNELAGMSEDNLAMELRNKEVVFARIAPEQKLTIVNALKLMGEVVAVTGDGVNDAPALKRADIGISMGLRGTDVAKDASDIILLDDNFATIIKAVEEGRGIYENIRKFIVYVLTSNIPEILPYIAYVIFPIPLPITVVQILCIDLITDMLPAIGLGNEKPESDTMLQPPRKEHERLVSIGTFLRSYAFLGLVESALSFFMFFSVLFNGGWRWGAVLPADSPLYPQAASAFLATIIFSQIGNVMACRTNRQSAIRYLARFNPWITAGIILELVFIVSIIYLPACHHFFNTRELGAEVWPGILSAPFIVFGIEELRKFVMRKRP